MLMKSLKWTAAAIGTLLAIALGFAGYVQIDGIPRYDVRIPERHVEVTPERVEHGKKLAGLLCIGCHVDAATHRLTGKRIADLPPEFGIVYSRNITQSKAKGIGAWTDGELAYFLRTGVRRDGQYVPPYMVKLPHASDEELDSIIAFLHSDDRMVAAADVAPPGRTQPSFLTKLLTHLIFKPLPFPTEPMAAPPKSDPVAYGRHLVFALDCYGCHSADFKTMNVLEPEKTPGYLGGGNAMVDPNGSRIFTANITPDDETGIGRYSEADFVRAVKRGFRPDGTVLHYPMEPRPELGDDEAAAIYAYLRTVPKIKNAVERPRDSTPPGDDGRSAYYRYGCVSCHGQKGVGSADLRRANEHFATDGQLVEWILDAPRLKPDTKMPGWRDVIAETDLRPLVAFVRHLSAESAAEHASNP